MRLLGSLALATVLSLGACGSSKSDRNDQTLTEKPPVGSTAPVNRGMGGGMMGGGMMRGGQGEPGGGPAPCPLQIASTTASAEDVAGGVAIRFTTTGDVAELRRRVTARVAMHTAGTHRGMGKGMGGLGAGGMGSPAMTHAEMMAADAKAEEIEGGARMVFTPKDPAKLEALRSEVRDHAAQMAATGQCPMLM